MLHLVFEKFIVLHGGQSVGVGVFLTQSLPRGVSEILAGLGVQCCDCPRHGFALGDVQRRGGTFFALLVA